MEWKVGNISMLRKEADLEEKKIGLSVIGFGGVKKTVYVSSSCYPTSPSFALSFLCL